MRSSRVRALLLLVTSNWLCAGEPPVAPTATAAPLQPLGAASTPANSSALQQPLSTAAASAASAGKPGSPLPTPPGLAPKKAEKQSDWVFSILPKSLQKNPRLELTVISEMTEAGKKRPPVTPDAPAYIELFSGGYRQLGDRAGNAKTVPPADLERLLKRSLHENGFLPAQPPAQPPSILVIYTWGTHNLLVEPDPENPSLSASAVAANLLDRASLVGGAKFAAKLLELFQRADDLTTAAGGTVAPGGEAVIGPDQLAFMNPVEMFKRADPKNEFMVDQTAADVYYVVASAYDYQSAATNRKILLWRTRMTVASSGISQEQSLPTLVLSAGPYFGRDMPDPEIIYKRTMREGTVELGTPTVIESAVPTPPGPKPPEKR